MQRPLKPADSLKSEKSEKDKQSGEQYLEGDEDHKDIEDEIIEALKRNSVKKAMERAKKANQNGSLEDTEDFEAKNQILPPLDLENLERFIPPKVVGQPKNL